VSKPRKYQLPDFINAQQTNYERWLHRRAIAHVKRDKKRGNLEAAVETYKMAIHRAVIDAGDRDYYTGEALNWSLISTYNNVESKNARRHYKAGFALLPTVDHVGDGMSAPDFRICAWRTNDAKNDLTHDDFVALCHRVVMHFQSSKR
jgi:hypothetical protein